MGAFLEKPITTKLTTSGEGQGLKYGVSAMQGWRKDMEDTHVCESNFLKDSAFFGVFDGHAGAKASEYCSENILRHLTDSIKKSEGSLKEGLKAGFLSLDAELRDKVQHGGTTAVTVVVQPEKIIWANCGDSRGLYCRDGKVEYCTEDHKPSVDKERRRIEEAGGSVMMQRVNGSLAVSRALGDFEFKSSDGLEPTKQMVSPEPEITILERDFAKDEFLLLACDGVYDVMSNEEVVEYVRQKLKLTEDLPKICSDLIDTCLAKNSRDNMSVILITFKAAPKVSADAIKEEGELKEKAKGMIEKKVQDMVDEANDPLDLEENYACPIVEEHLKRELDLKFPEELRPYTIERLNEKKKEKFGEQQMFDGPSDPSDAPSDFIYRLGGTNVYIAPETDEVPMQTDPSEPKADSENTSRPSDNLSSLQTDATPSV